VLQITGGTSLNTKAGKSVRVVVNNQDLNRDFAAHLRIVRSKHTPEGTSTEFRPNLVFSDTSYHGGDRKTVVGS
jgi:hypothetical protein